MAEHNEHRERIKRLVAQDPEINDTHMKEFRMQLEQALESSEAKAKQTRRRILTALLVYWGAIAVCVYLTSLLPDSAIGPKLVWLKPVIGIPAFLSGIVAMILLLLHVVLYLFRDGPRLSKARFDVQSGMLLELHEQVKVLREKIDGRRG